MLALTDLPWPVFALKAGVPVRLVSRLLSPNGRRLPRLPRDSAIRILGLTDESIAELGRTLVPADDTRRQLGELLAAGCEIHTLARYCRLPQAKLLDTVSASRCTELTALLVRSAALQYQAKR
jgi:hypothetical protein